MSAGKMAALGPHPLGDHIFLFQAPETGTLRRTGLSYLAIRDVVEFTFNSMNRWTPRCRGFTRGLCPPVHPGIFAGAAESAQTPFSRDRSCIEPKCCMW